MEICSIKHSNEKKLWLLYLVFLHMLRECYMNARCFITHRMLALRLLFKIAEQSITSLLLFFVICTKQVMFSQTGLHKHYSN